MEMTAVTSSNIVAVGHEGETMRIQFTNGLYEYKPVSEKEFVHLRDAESVGRYYHQNKSTWGVGVRVEKE